MKIDNTVVWITGVTSGIGKELVREFSKYNCKFILTSRNQQKLEELKKELNLNDSNVLLQSFDLSNYKEIPKIVNQAIDKFQKIDIVIHNAGITQRALAKETEITTTEKIFALDFFAPVYLTKLILPYLSDNGNITVISSVAGKFESPYRSSYSAAKHALHGFFDSLRIELLKEKSKINILIVCPGFVKTNISFSALKGDGSLHNILDENIAKGLNPNYVAKQIIKAIQREKKEIVISGFREKLALFLKKFFPNLLIKILTKVKVT